MQNVEKENLKLKMELATIIMGYETELAKEKRKEISDFSKGCMKRYFQLIEELNEENDASVNQG
jgi:hypothetical protein